MLKPDEMAFLTEQLRQEIKKNQLASTEKKRLECDYLSGKHGLPIYPFGIPVIKMSEEPIKITKDSITRIAALGTDDYEQNNGNVDLSGIFVLDDGQLRYIGHETEDTYPWITIAGEDVATDEGVIEKGTYFTIFGYNGFPEGKTGFFYVTLLEYKETHPIPQEYIPPLDALYMNGTDGVRYKPYVDAAGQLQVEVV